MQPSDSHTVDKNLRAAVHVSLLVQILSVLGANGGIHGLCPAAERLCCAAAMFGQETAGFGKQHLCMRRGSWVQVCLQGSRWILLFFKASTLVSLAIQFSNVLALSISSIIESAVRSNGKRF